LSIASQIPTGSIVLDAGAGSKAYEYLFSHVVYESTDHIDPNSIHTFVCDLSNIPKPDAIYDAILNTQVLEHVPYPQKIIDEFYRVLKPNGKLFLTAPQQWGLHEEPNNFFNFTRYGLELLFKNAGFSIEYIEPRGGVFELLGQLFYDLPSYVLQQYKPKGLGIVRILFSLAYRLIFRPIFQNVFPVMFHFFDKIDKNKTFCLGYKCLCIKK
jgi:SAM-dependent methyltransferase